VGRAAVVGAGARRLLDLHCGFANCGDASGCPGAPEGRRRLPPGRRFAAEPRSGRDRTGEQAKIKAELLAARDRQASTAAAQDSAAK